MGEYSAGSRVPCFVVGVESERAKAIFKFVQLSWTKFAGVSSVLARRLCMRGEQGRDRLPSLGSNVFELRNWVKIDEGGVGSLTPGEESVWLVAVSKMFPGLVLKSFFPPSFGDASQAVRK